MSCLGQSYYFLAAQRADSRRVLQRWFQTLKGYCTLLNLRSYYEIGNLLGKGNFARVYEATLATD